MFRYATLWRRTLTQHPLRAALLVLASFVAATGIALCGSVRAGTDRLLARAAIPGQLIVTQRDRTDPLASSLPDSAVYSIRHVPGVTEATAVLLAALPVALADGREPLWPDALVLWGVAPELRDLLDVPVPAALWQRWRERDNGVVLGVTAARRLRARPGFNLTLPGLGPARAWHTLAVLPSTGGVLDSAVLVHRPMLQGHAGLQGLSTMLIADIGSADPGAVGAAIDRRLTREDSPSTTLTSGAFLRRVLAPLAQLADDLVWLSALLALVPAIVAFALARRTCRTRVGTDGLLRAFGLSRARLAGLLAFESLMPALIGGVLGALVAATLVGDLDLGVSLGGVRVPFGVTTRVAFTAVVATVGATLAGVLPAAIAAAYARPAVSHGALARPTPDLV